MFREKNTNDLHVKNSIFQKVRKCPLNIDCMLNILQKRIKKTTSYHIYVKGKKTTQIETKKAD